MQHNHIPHAENLRSPAKNPLYQEKDIGWVFHKLQAGRSVKISPLTWLLESFLFFPK